MPKRIKKTNSAKENTRGLLAWFMRQNSAVRVLLVAILPVVLAAFFQAVTALIPNLVEIKESGKPKEVVISYASTATSSAPSLTKAQPDETLIIVAAFHDRSAGKFSGIDVGERVYDLINERLPGGRTRVEKYPIVVKDSEEGRAVMHNYGATILIWGWYDSIGAEPKIELNKDILKMDNPNTGEINLATPDTFVLRFSQDIPAQSAYLSFFSLGMAQANSGKLDEAVSYFTEAIKSTEIAQTGLVNPWEAFVWRGNIYFWSAEYELAINDYSSSIELHPNKEAYFNRADAYRRLGNIQAAISGYTKVIEIDPKYAMAYFGRGVVYNQIGDYQAAISDYSKAIEIDPHYASVYPNRAWSYSAIGDKQAAILDYTKVIEIVPKYALAYLNRAYVFKELGEYDSAGSDCSKVIELLPRNTEGYICRGNVYADSKDFEKAIESYQLALSIAKEPYAFCVLGITYTKMGDFENGLINLENGVKMDSSDQFPWCKIAFENAKLGTPTP